MKNKNKTKEKKKEIRYILIIIILIILLVWIDYSNTQIKNSKNIITNSKTKESISININIKAFMCQTIDCEEVYIRLINRANSSLYCAFFDFDLENLNKAIKNKQITKAVYVDGDNKHFNETYIIYENKSSFMHNKFCIIDNTITITGSFNPTINGKNKNDNNILIMKSNNIADIYTSYFKELLKEHYSSYKNRSNMKKNYNLEFSNANISICFSRGGKCLKKIREQVTKAQTSVQMMLFTMTDKQITDQLLMNYYNITNPANTTDNKINAIFDRSLISRYSSYHKLSHHNLNITKSCSKGKLHHKVFIIDNSTIITGSMNPSNNAEKNNDENLIIVNNQEIAEKYLNEFNRIYTKCTT